MQDIKRKNLIKRVSKFRKPGKETNHCPGIFRLFNRGKAKLKSGNVKEEN